MPRINKIQKKPKSTSHNNTDMRELRRKVYATTAWKKLRLSYMKEHPICEECLKKGKVTPAEDIHHKRSFVQRGQINWDLAYDDKNLMAVCKECHQEIHAKQQGYVSPEEVIKQLEDLFNDNIPDSEL